MEREISYVCSSSPINLPFFQIKEHDNETHKNHFYFLLQKMNELTELQNYVWCRWMSFIVFYVCKCTVTDQQILCLSKVQIEWPNHLYSKLTSTVKNHRLWKNFQLGMFQSISVSVDNCCLVYCVVQCTCCCRTITTFVNSFVKKRFN